MDFHNKEILKPVGNLPDYDWNFSKLWYSSAMDARREEVADGCFCTHESNCYYPSPRLQPAAFDSDQER